GLVAVVSLLLAVACGGPGSVGAGGTVEVVAGENFWGDIASQLGGSHARIQSVVTDPNADPHEYESNTNDARAFATANLVILNGAGYDGWARKLLDANPSSGRKVLDVASLLAKKSGDNPHFWYDPDYVIKVAGQITAELKSIDSSDASYFDEQRSAFTNSLAPYMRRLAEIKQKFAGVPVGSTESIFVYMASYLGLQLISPAEFMQAVAEGNDPPAETVVTFHDQIAKRAIKVLVYNVQTATAVTTNLRIEATRQSIPVVGVSETLQPVTASFQEWQDSQLIALENALNAAALVQ
ncbi:MAG TPA: zinc ABC transporter substrate-binding protein, partial [Candidatus Dormibacteraeota bacterium]|nr:zinc ABC transporter substrate-binding protein [Candidatus Dormibacteraeota bacterium]